MAVYLLDTNVVSELRKVSMGRAHPGVAAWAHSVAAEDLYVAVITLQEIAIGVQLTERRDPAQGQRLRAWFEERVLPAFDARVLVVDIAVALRSAGLHVPDPSPVRDGLIAATALVHGMTVVTRNTADFTPSGVAVLNPWEFESPSTPL